MKKLVLLVCALAGWLGPLHGEVLLTDAFDYPDGSLITVSAGTWGHHNGSITGEVDVVSGRVFLTQNETEDVSVPLPGEPYGATTNVLLYASFTLNVTNTPSDAGTFFAHYKASGTSGAQRGKVFVTTNGVPASFYRVGVANNANVANVLINSNLTFNTDYLLVLRYAPSNAATALWLNPTAETDPSIIATDVVTTISVTAFALRQSFTFGNGDGMGSLFLQNLVIGTSFSDVVSNSPPQPPTIITQPQSLTATQGDNATFTVVASGSAPLSYQWQFYSTNLAGAMSSALILTNVTTADAGPYTVTVTNSLGSTNSQTATLTVDSLPVTGFSILTYNVKGNGATDWTTNAAQVQAIARQLQYLQPDIITFNEIPWDLKYEMTNFISVFLPGYKLAVSTGTDGAICSAIASRFSITRSNKWLDGIDLRGFGYSNANNSLDNFTRDLYETQISVPGFARPLHVFTTHLKSTSGTTYADASSKRAAEAAAITNFFATNLFVLYPNDPYTLSGDMNDADTNALAIQRLISLPTGLRLTNPANPITGSINTFSTSTANPGERVDYIFPHGLLFSNMRTSQVFRTDKLNPVPPNLNSNDDKVASDHLPVMMVFNNPYDKPFRLLSITRSNPSVTLTWQSVPGQPYRVDSSSNLAAWTGLASNLVATGMSYVLTTNVIGDARFFRVYRIP